MVAVLLGTASAETVVIALGNEDPPGGNGKYTTFDVPSINNSGQVAFSANLSDTIGGYDDSFCLVRGNEDTALLVARAGQASPDNNGSFLGFHAPALNNNNESVFIGYMTGTMGGNADATGIFKADGLATPVTIVRQGQAAPDNIGAFYSFGIDLVMNDAGNAAFSAIIDLKNGGTQRDQDGLFRGDGVTAPVRIARKGQLTPSGNGTYSNLYGVSLNESNQVAFHAALSGTLGGTSDNDGLFLSDGSAPTTEIARRGQAVPDGNGDFSSFDTPVVNDAGQVAFYADLLNTDGGDADNAALFRGDGVSGPVTIARSGQTVPGAPGTFTFFNKPSINNVGQLATKAWINLNNGGSTYDETGIILGDDTPGSLVWVAREGQPSPDGNGAFVNFSSHVLNNAGHMAFEAGISISPTNYDRCLVFYDPVDGLQLIVRKGMPLLDSTIFTYEYFNSGAYTADGRTALNDSGEVTFKFYLNSGKWGIAKWSRSPGPVTPPQVTDFQVQMQSSGDTNIILEWKTSSAATGFNIRYSEDLSLPPASWPIFAGAIPREEPSTRFEGLLPLPYKQVPKLFFIVEEVN